MKKQHEQLYRNKYKKHNWLNEHEFEPSQETVKRRNLSFTMIYRYKRELVLLTQTRQQKQKGKQETE